MRTTTAKHGDYEVWVHHNSDWSGPARVHVRRRAKTVVDIEISGEVILKLAVELLRPRLEIVFEEGLEDMLRKALSRKALTGG